MDGPWLPGSQSEGDGKNASGLAELDALFDIPLPPFYRKHTSQTLSRNARNLSPGAAFQGGDYTTQINCSPVNISGVSTQVRVTLLPLCSLLSD